MLVVMASAIGLSTAARVEQQFGPKLISGARDQPTTRLNTYYFDVSSAKMELSAHGSSRPERTAVTVQLTEETVGRFMPVVSPQPSGMMHTVSKTWQALKVSCTPAMALL